MNTLQEIKKMDNGQGLSVQSSLGGYNCRHTWVAVPDADVQKKKEVTVGKQTLLMDESRSNEFFAYNRRAYVEAEKKFQFGSDSRAIAAAKALAYAHDGLNERITNQPADGIWRAKLPVIVEADGKKRTYTNFELHAKKRIEEKSVQSINEYRRAIADVIRNGDNNVYSMNGENGKQRYIIYDEQTRWMVMLNKFGAIETAHKKTFSKKFKSGLTPLGTVKTLIGDFHER